jgi:uncharacterized protein
MFILSGKLTGRHGVYPIPSECRCCGDCCSTMGEIISIRDEVRPFEFRIGFTDGEERVVSIDPDKRVLFLEPLQGIIKSHSCPFLRPLAPDKRICTVHASRPELCRIYHCSRLLLLNGDGTKEGRVLEKGRSATR